MKAVIAARLRPKRSAVRIRLVVFVIFTYCNMLGLCISKMTISVFLHSILRPKICWGHDGVAICQNQ